MVNTTFLTYEIWSLVLSNLLVTERTVHHVMDQGDSIPKRDPKDTVEWQRLFQKMILQNMSTNGVHRLQCCYDSPGKNGREPHYNLKHFRSHSGTHRLQRTTFGGILQQCDETVCRCAPHSEVRAFPHLCKLLALLSVFIFIMFRVGMYCEAVRRQTVCDQYRPFGVLPVVRHNPIVFSRRW